VLAFRCGYRNGTRNAIGAVDVKFLVDNSLPPGLAELLLEAS
jgi:hypothetical protein